MTQGRFANSAGNTLESTVISTFASKNFTILPYSQYRKNPTLYGSELLLKNAPFTTIYAHAGQTEFLAKSERYQFEIRIECKWQQSAGSVDEKFPYLYLNCIEQMPEKTIFIIVDGGGAKQGALTSLKQACQKKLYTSLLTHEKEIIIMSLVDFIVWANKTLR